MKRLFNRSKPKRGDVYADFPASAPSPAGEAAPPPSSSTPPNPPSRQSNGVGAGTRGGAPYGQHQVQYGPDGRAYMLVPVPMGGGVPPGMVPAQGGGHLPRPPKVQDVGNAIGWSCAMPSFDWGYVLALADYISQGTKKGPAEEAAKALRKEFKHATPTAQLRAVRLTFLLARNSDLKFRREICQKKFLAQLAELVESGRTEPGVKEMVFRVLSALAWDFQDDPTLAPLSQTFSRLLTSPSTSLSTFANTLDASSPAFAPSGHGAPLAEDDDLLRPESLLSSRGGGGRRSGRGAERERLMMSAIEQMRDLRRRAVEGKGYAGMLLEALQNKRDGENVEGDEMVQEFYHHTLLASEFLSQNLDWATVQAEQSRAALSSSRSTSPPTASPATPEAGAAGAAGLASNNPFAPVVAGAGAETGDGRKKVDEGMTEEEEILGVLLSASTEISESLAFYASRLASSRQDAQEAADLAAATERSKQDYKYDRFKPEPMSHERERTHSYGEGGSGAAGAASPVEADGGYEVEQPPTRRDKGKGRARESLNPYAEYLDGSSSASPAPTPAPALTNAQGGGADDPYGGLDAFADLSFSSSPASATPNSAVPAQLQNGNYAPPASLPAPVAEQPQQAKFARSNPYASLSLSSRASPAPASASPFDDQFASYPSQPAAPPAGVSSFIPSPSPFADGEATLQAPLGTTESAFLREFVPEEPSAKALGKLRRVSVREDASPALASAQQQKLEDALKEKYHRQYEEERARRAAGGDAA
ncbi:hypothetical protein JCM10213_008638 [Rhodosporidiobolus nylandii]